jgi:hypothetical protein
MLMPQNGRAETYDFGDQALKPRFTGEELQVKFLPDSGENSLKY